MTIEQRTLGFLGMCCAMLTVLTIVMLMSGSLRVTIAAVLPFVLAICLGGEIHRRIT